jgi:hypothetical protein
MRWILTIALAVSACHGGSTRDADCEQVRDVLDGVPRRYRAAAIADKLASAKLRDDDVQAAVRDGDLAKLESLCELVPGAHQHAAGTRGDARLQDCRLVLMWVPTEQDEAKGEGLFDPSVPNAEFRDPQIRAAMKELEDSGWTPFAPPQAKPDPRLAKLRELCHYPR